MDTKDKQNPHKDFLTFGDDVLNRYDLELQHRKEREYFGVDIADVGDEGKPFSPVAPQNENEASAHVTVGGSFNTTSIDMSQTSIGTANELIIKYRNAALFPEVDQAIEDIVNEAIVANDDEDELVTVNLDMVPTGTIKDGTSDKISTEFSGILNLLQFRKFGHDIFRRFYVDGSLNYHMVTDLTNTKKGVVDLRPISPFKIQKIKEIIEDTDPKTGQKFVLGTEEYFVYSENGFTQGKSSAGVGSSNLEGLKLPTDAVAHVTSGILDATKQVNMSYIHKALKIVNQLRMMEDALVINRLARAPHRRAFYIDTGKMPKSQAETYINNLARKHRNQMTYDSTTGTTKNNKHHEHMQEDIWLARSDSGKGTEVSNLDGASNLGDIEDIEFLQKKLYQSLNVPVSRLDPDTGYVIGRAAEINRDELRFQKFIDRLRLKFSDLFKQVLRTQCILKGILTAKEWNEIDPYIVFDFSRDNFFAELKEAEILKERIGLLNTAKEHIGTFYSDEYVRRHILKQSEAEIKEIKEQIRAEHISNKGLPDPEEDVGEGGGGGGFEGDLGTGGDLGGDDFGGDLGDEEGFEDDLGDPTGSSTELGVEDLEEPLDAQDFDAEDEEFDADDERL